MIHLPKKRPWLILILIYVVIVAVWGLFFYLAKQNGDQSVDPIEAKQLLEKQRLQDNSKIDAQ